MKRSLTRYYACCIALVITLSACNKDNGPGNAYTGPNFPTALTNSPIDVAKIRYNLSLGWIQPSGHTIPTDHVYFWYDNPNNTTVIPVYAPASAKVYKILVVPVAGVQECKVWFRVNEKFIYYLDHIVPDPSLKDTSSVVAGQKIGTTGWGQSIDLGVADDAFTLTGFANPKRYYSEQVHCGKPFSYFTEPLRTQLYALVDREGTDKDGKIDIDVPGKLVGNWFLDGATFYTDGPDGWDKELSFAFDIQHPSIPLVSIGGTIGLTGKWTIQDGVPLPAEVGVATGKIAYRLFGSKQDTFQRGLMIVQMIDETHIKVQVFPGSTAGDAAFDANAKIYAR